MRAGAGWVRVGVPASLNPIFEVKLTEVMTVPLADENGSLTLAAMDAVMEAAERADAVVLGPGLGREPDSVRACAGLAERIEQPLLVDADGLNALAESGLERAGWSRSPRPSSRPTRASWPPARAALGGGRGPPPGGGPRGGRAFGRGRRAEGRRHARRRARRAHGASAGRQPGARDRRHGRRAERHRGAFLAQGLDPFEAACAAVRIHAEAGRERGRGTRRGVGDRRRRRGRAADVLRARCSGPAAGTVSSPAWRN